MVPVDEGDELTRPRPPVEPSAPMELVWLGHQLLNPRPEVAERFAVMGAERAALVAERLRSFWDDGVSGGVGELLVLADHAGLLFAQDLDELLNDLPVWEGDLSQVGLRSESAADRPRFIKRLTVLQRDPQTRRRYAGVLRDIWEPMRPEWETTGLPAVLAACRWVGRRLDQGAELEEMLPALAKVTAKKAEWGAIVDEALEKGRLVLNPGYFVLSWNFWDLPQHVVVGFNGNPDPLADAKKVGQQLAPRLRALGDPTRLTILLYLAERPTSVGEVARRFELAQPTVSAHLRALRGAGLVAGTRSEGRTVYHVEQERLAELLQELADSTGVALGR